jgi:AraC family transcriptional activator of pobA
MNQPPAFLRKPMGAAPTTPKGEIRCGSFALRAQAAPWEWSMLHDRPDNVLLWLTRGQGRVVVNGIRRGISMHNALYLPAGTLFSLDIPPTVQALVVESPVTMTARLPHEALLLRIRDGFCQAELTGTIDTMNREITQARPYMQDALAAHLQLIGVWLQRQVKADLADHPAESAGNRLMRRFAQMVVRDYASRRNVADYANYLDVTPTYLTRVTRRCCGKTAAEVINDRKLYAARIALTTTTTPLQQISEDLGFSTPAYFSRFIQTHLGQAPSRIRTGAKRPKFGAQK